MIPSGNFKELIKLQMVERDLIYKLQMDKTFSSLRQQRWGTLTINQQKQHRGHSLVPALPVPLLCWPLLPLHEQGVMPDTGVKGENKTFNVAAHSQYSIFSPQQGGSGRLFPLFLSSTSVLLVSSSDQQNSCFSSPLRDTECIMLYHVHLPQNTT